MIVTAREFTSAAEMRAAALAAHDRLFNPKNRYKPVAPKIEIKTVALPVREPAPVLVIPGVGKFKPKAMRDYANIWELAPTQFNHHVIVWRRHMLAADLAEQGVEALHEDFEERMQIIDIVIDVLTSFPGVTVEDVRGSRRCRRVVLPRQIAMYQCYVQRKDISLPMIGRWFGGRDHTTVLHAIRKIEKMRGAE